jgi:Zn-dependent membrane protease YugP
MFYIDPVYFWYVFIPVLVISLGVQFYLRSTNKKWSKVKNGSGLTGEQVAQQLFNRTTLQAIRVEHVSGILTDHFDPGANVVRLSDSTARVDSVSAMAVTAHELGHVLGLWFNMTGMLWLGIIFFAIMVLFSLLTLPVEIDASRRGLRMLDEAGLMVSAEDKQGSNAVLRAAALTYLAAAITSILQLLYYISVAQRRS